MPGADQKTSILHLGGRTVGAGHPCFLVAEVAQAHDGSLGTAHAYIDAAADAGVDAIKFQTHIARAESTRREPWRVRFSPQDETRYAYWERMEFTEAQWEGLARHAGERGLEFLSSPFSQDALDLLHRVGVPAWKVAAGELTNHPLLEAMARTGLPVLLSTGMGTDSELADAVTLVRRRGAPVGIYQCTSRYPCPPEELGLELMAAYRERFGCPTGLSDHSGTAYAGLAAAALGADMVEVHVTFSRACFGPDVPASLTTEELATLVEGVRFVERALAHPVDKDAMADTLSDLRSTFTKSLVAAGDLPAGHLLREEDLKLKKPGSGLPPSKIDALLHRRLKRDVTEDTLLSEDDVE